MPAMDGPKFGDTKSTDVICWAHEAEFLLDKFKIVCKKKKKKLLSVCLGICLVVKKILSGHCSWCKQVLKSVCNPCSVSLCRVSL